MFRVLVLLLCFIAPVIGQSPGKESAVRFQPRIASQADFDKLSRIYYQGRFYALPHLMFVIDRSADKKIYYVNSKRYSFHTEFVSANYLSLERGREFFKHNYLEANRRFILGTIAYQTKLGKFTFEFWEGDLATAEIIEETYQTISAGFFAPVAFKPNSARQEEVSKQLANIPRLLAAEINAPQDYVPLHQAKGVGVLRILDRMTDETILDRNEIVIFRESPITLTPVSGIVTTAFSTPLAHVNLLAKGWGVPNAYIKNAVELFKPLEGKFVYLETREDGYTLRRADSSETAEAGRKLAERSDLLTPEADLDFKSLVELNRQRKTDAKRFGAKSANLGEVAHAAAAGQVADIVVPAGFSIPFFYYRQFIEENKLDEAILEMLGNDRFNHDPVYRKQRLAEMRARLQAAKLNEEFARAIVAKKRLLFGDKGVFARSSTNSEDLPNFSGAGLYTTVPNVRDDAALLEAIKTVWASLWNYEAYEARESFGINHAAVYPAVLVQEGMNAEAAGVLITTNPFDKEDRRSVYVNAKRGLGIRVVEGRRVPEQLLFNPRTAAVRVLTRSGDDTMLTFDERGGVREMKTDTERAVLTDAVVRRLARAALRIERVFGGRDQDIEWLTIGNRIYIVQSRPYVEK
ncbi:MAG TPA: PEP/pyruvate-binding domain-containing protein [Blastocatellia bacterium]|nr:PEP/pyruvate-binding domain-containing protein [Blastocatellia bacterium]HMV84734.1 PEP/pyruvate-binding domain-containing protein [Blastocatellia bacterium]HMY71463.1 PEP/pyruvate-binding domain-containing protein [Blastocatellia bacterium]HMZ22942.1 PEP/pyruvate-binding domain-containing protein [Blastocatellia bacterium]HNG30328.1 PEP/pyruvate-binding domain-containing protein [Blastocatellia bacterium]